MASKSKKPVQPKLKRPEIPLPFSRSGLICDTVESLIGLLEMLPRDLPVAEDDFMVLRVTVTNNGLSAPGDPYLTFDVEESDE